MSKRIVIVGGGLAGLTTAYYLLKQGRAEAGTFEITVLEAESDPGGQTRAFKVPARDFETGDEIPNETFTVEHGSHVFFNYYDNVIKIIDELRADPDIGPSMPGFSRVPGWTIVDAYGHRATLKQTPGLPEPFSVLPSIFSISWLSLVDRLRIALGSWNIINEPYDRFGELDKKTSYELATEMGYSDMGVLAWNSASLGLTNLFVKEQSGAIFAGKHKVLINTPEGLSYQLPAGDLSELIPRPLRKKLEKQGARVVLGARAKRIHRPAGDKRTRVVYEKDGVEHTIEGEYVISALRPHDVGPLLPWVQAKWKELGPVTPVITVVLRFDGLVQQSIDDRELGLSREQWAFSVVTDLSHFWPEYEGKKTVLRCEIGHADRFPRGADIPDDEVMRMIRVDLERLFPEVEDRKIEAYAIHRETVQLYTKWVAGEWSKKPEERDVGQGVYLAGDWTTKGTIGMEAAANSGIEAANHVLVSEGLPPIPFRDVPL